MSILEGCRDGVEEVQLELHGILYVVSVLVHGEDLLVVKIEDKDTLDTWHGEFAAKYVEDITSKTGSFKKFSIFVRMLQSAVLQQSDSVFIDLLTCQDLELLKAKKAAAAQADAAAQQQQQQPRQLPSGLANKRYLILTYASEFDRVHYPLPLMADEQPDPARFKAVIASLRQQLAEVQAGLPPPQLLQPQGGQQLLLGGPRARSRAGAQAEADTALLASRLEVAQAELEGERAAHRREMRKKMREVQELQEELGRSRDIARELRLRITKLESDLEAARSSGGMAAATAGKGTYRRPAAADRYSYGNTSYLSGSSKFPSRPGNQYAGLRNTSRGSSPASSRGQSPSQTRPWAQNSTPPRPPRPSSAPPKQRFDPTEYVRQKREREQQLLASRRSNSVGRGNGSPAPSMRSMRSDHSGASTPRSRLSDSFSLSDRRTDRGPPGGGARPRGGSSGGAAGRTGVPSDVRGSSYGGRGGSSGGGYGSDRAGSAGRQQRSGGSGGYDVGRPGSLGRQMQRPGSSGSAKDQLGAIYCITAGRSTGGRPSSRPSSRQRLDNDTASGRDGPGAASPGRALQGVRDKLDAYYAKQQQQQQQQRMHAGAVRTTQASPAAYKGAAAAAAMGSPRQQLAAVPTAAAASSKAAGNGVFKDASSEIADIDQRLHALQNFLKMAKSSVAGA